jgi:hypothetical protein
MARRWPFLAVILPYGRRESGDKDESYLFHGGD